MSRHDLVIASDGFWNRKISIDQILEWFGTAGLFARGQLRVFALVYPSGVAQWIVFQLLTPHEKEGPDTMRALEEIGKFLLKTPGPWVKRGAKAEPHMLLDPYIRRPKKHIDSIVFGPNQAFAIFSILAVGFEAVEHRHGDFVADLQKSDLARLSEILLLLKAREDRELDHAAIAQAQRRLDFGAEHIAFINDWIGKKFNLVERRPKKQPKQ